MLNILDLVGENQQMIFTAEQVERFMENTQQAATEGLLVPEPIAIYHKHTMTREHAYIVRRGAGPFNWVANYTHTVRKLVENSERIFLTKGEYQASSTFKSVNANINRNFPAASRRTLWGVSNIPTESSDRISHHIFQVMEIMVEEIPPSRQ